MHNVAVAQIQTLLSLLDAVLATLPPATAQARPPMAVERICAFCLAWSAGGLLEPSDRRALDAHLRTLMPDGLMPKVQGAMCSEGTISMRV